MSRLCIDKEPSILVFLTKFTRRIYFSDGKAGKVGVGRGHDIDGVSGEQQEGKEVGVSVARRVEEQQRVGQHNKGAGLRFAFGNEAQILNERLEALERDNYDEEECVNEADLYDVDDDVAV